MAILRVEIREMVHKRTEIGEGRWRKFTENVAKVTQNNSYSHFHVPVPGELSEKRSYSQSRSLINEIMVGDRD